MSSNAFAGDQPELDDGAGEHLSGGCFFLSEPARSGQGPPGRWQPWDFVVVTERDELRELSGVWQGAGHVAGTAATIALVAPVPQDEGQRART